MFVVWRGNLCGVVTVSLLWAGQVEGLCSVAVYRTHRCSVFDFAFILDNAVNFSKSSYINFKECILLFFAFSSIFISVIHILNHKMQKDLIFKILIF